MQWHMRQSCIQFTISLTMCNENCIAPIDAWWTAMVQMCMQASLHAMRPFSNQLIHGMLQVTKNTAIYYILHQCLGQCIHSCICSYRCVAQPSRDRHSSSMHNAYSSMVWVATLLPASMPTLPGGILAAYTCSGHIHPTCKWSFRRFTYGNLVTTSPSSKW